MERSRTYSSPVSTPFVPDRVLTRVRHNRRTKDGDHDKSPQQDPSPQPEGWRDSKQYVRVVQDLKFTCLKLRDLSRQVEYFGAAAKAEKVAWERARAREMEKAMGNATGKVKMAAVKRGEEKKEAKAIPRQVSGLN